MLTMLESLPFSNTSTTARSGNVRRLRVMIVDDSRVIREFLSEVIGGDPRFDVVALADSGERAIKLLRTSRPDVISMDICLPGMDGFETTRQIMAERATPIVVVAGMAEESKLKTSINALQAGALTVLEKPSQAKPGDLEEFGQRLCTQLFIMSNVKVVTRRKTPRVVLEPNVSPGKAELKFVGARRHYEMVGIVASTGGPSALIEVLGKLGSNYQAPILVVQHISSGFSRAFIQWLDDACALRVIEARSGMRPEPSHVYVAPTDVHLTLTDRGLQLQTTERVSMQRPSGTVLLRSMAETLGPAAIGVVLTGMGDDGAEGLYAIRQAGGYTLCEDESTAVVYGMPKAARELGATCESLPLPRIGTRLLELMAT